MKQNNTIISIIKTKIGNFLIELDKKSIIKFLPTNKQVSYNSPDIKEIENNLYKYFLGKKKIFNYKITPYGTEFQKKVWNEILKIEYGNTISYYELAKILDSSPRAIGNACAKNPCILFIPCHRVILKNNSSGNYLMGHKIKKNGMKLLKKMNRNFKCPINHDRPK